MIYTDPSGLQWEIIDYTLDQMRSKKKRVDLGSWSAEGRAFVPVGREGTVMLYEFGRVAYRDTSERNLAEQLRRAKPAGASPWERMQRDGPNSSEPL